MSRKTVTFFITIFFFLVTIKAGGNRTKLDSLENVLNAKQGVQRIEVLLNLSKEYNNIDVAKSIQYASEALQLSQKNDLSSFEARATYDLGYAYYLNNDYNNAITYLENASTLSQKFKNRNGEAIALNRLGNTYQLKGNYEKALEYYTKALAINESTGNKKEIGRTLTNLGSIYRIYGIFEKAVDYDLQALELYEEVGYKEGMAWLFINIARLYKEMKEFGKALDNVEKSYQNYNEIEKLTGNKTGITLCLNEFASIYYKSGNLTKALEYSQGVLKINEETGNDHGKANSIAEIGKIYFEQGKYSMSLALLKESLDLKDEINDNAGLASIYRYIGNIHVKLGNYKNAEAHINKCIENAGKLNLRTELKEAYFSLVNLYTLKKDFKHALVYQNLYSDLKDSLNIKSITKLEMQYEFDKKQRQDEFERLRKEAIHQAELKRERIVKYFAFGGFILMILIAFLILKNLREKKKANAELREKNEEILQQKEEITAQRDEIENQKNVAEQQRDKIQHQNKVITDSIQYAKRIQRAVLPKTDMLQEKFNDYFILYKPRDIVSGDFYWFNELDNSLIVVAADCTGHGVPGAFMSMMGIAYLNEIANKKEVNEVDKVLALLRENVIKSQHQTGEYRETKDGMDMAILLFDMKKSEVHFAGANCPVFLIRNKELIEYKPDRMPIGIYFNKECEPFTRHVIKYQKGDVFYLFSDGYADQFGGKDGLKFMLRQFKEVLLKHHDKPMEKQKEILETKLADWRGTRNQIDDVLVVGMRV